MKAGACVLEHRQNKPQVTMSLVRTDYSLQKHEWGDSRRQRLKRK